MSERGVYAVDRGIWSDPDFADEPFTEREAFLWLVGEAAWRPTKARVGSAIIELARGQCAFSTRFMAQKWRWSEARVRRYLGRLSNREMICTKTDARATQITICKYDAFQRVSLPTDARATQERRKEEDRENIDISLSSADEGEKSGWPVDAFDRWYARYPHKVAKPKAKEAFERIRKRGDVPFDSLMSGLEAYIATKPADVAWCNPATWLNGERWSDAPAPRSSGPPRSNVVRHPANPKPRTIFDAIRDRFGEEPDEPHGLARGH